MRASWRNEDTLPTFSVFMTIVFAARSKFIKGGGSGGVPRLGARGLALARANARTRTITRRWHAVTHFVMEFSGRLMRAVERHFRKRGASSQAVLDVESDARTLSR